jgi:hypothetical protein
MDTSSVVASGACLEIHSFDWSGSGHHPKRQNGIAHASGRPGAAPLLRHGYSREQVLELLCALSLKAKDGPPILVGGDFAFAFPFVAKGRAYPDGTTDRDPFWAGVRNVVWNGGRAQDYAARYAEHFMWHTAGAGMHVGARYVPALRATDSRAREIQANANTVFRLIGADQVGKGSLTGIAMLEELRRQCAARGLPLATWPFFADSDGVSGPWALPSTGLVVVETYPSLCWRRAGFAGRPWDDPAAWDRVRRWSGGLAPIAAPATGDEGDALVAWYALAGERAADGSRLGLSWLRSAATSTGEHPADVIAAEGWMFLL